MPVPKCLITVRVMDNKPQQVPAIKVEGGLAITECLKSENQSSPSLYHITHVASGYRLTPDGGITKCKAYAILRDLLPLTDWTQSRTSLKKLPKALHEQFRNICKRHTKP